MHVLGIFRFVSWASRPVGRRAFVNRAMPCWPVSAIRLQSLTRSLRRTPLSEQSLDGIALVGRKEKKKGKFFNAEKGAAGGGQVDGLCPSGPLAGPVGKVRSIHLSTLLSRGKRLFSPLSSLFLPKKTSFI